MKSFIPFIILLLSFTRALSQITISVIAPKNLLDTSITAITIADVQQLLGQACGCAVKLNDTSAKVLLKLPVDK